MALIIDGYNLLRIIEAESDSAAPMDVKELCDKLRAYLKTAKENAKIVFDGTGPLDKTGIEGGGRLSVIFSGTHREADDIIEDLIRTDSAARLLKVVSNDRRIKHAAKKKKATPVPCDDFWKQLIKTTEQANRRIAEPKGKAGGITESETDLWMKEFGLD